MRRKLIAGNWKMNLNLIQMRELVAGIRAGCEAPHGASASSPTVEIAICPPFPYLFAMADTIAGGEIRLGAQDVFHEAAGAFTGEVSPAMLVDARVTYVIIGHSERRHTIGHLEDDRMVNLKLRAALAAGLHPILCVGETLEERKLGRTNDVLGYQISAALIDATVKSPDQLVVAYEPVWAIGTGLHATPAQAQEAHAFLRARLAGHFASMLSDSVRILYGGSLKPDNAAEIMRQPDVDGGLVGGASLKADLFVGIIRAAIAATT